MSEHLDSEQRARLWEFRQHTEDQIYSRMTVFLTYETILTGVVGVLYTNKSQLPRPLLPILIVLGMFITLIWLYVQHNIKQIFVILETRAYDNLPDHKETLDRIFSVRRAESRLGLRRPALMLLTYVVPILILLVWFVFLLFQLQWFP
jgi:hypothetical protein